MARLIDPSLRGLSSEDLRNAHEAALAALHEATDATAVKECYSARVLPLEAERIRRGADGLEPLDLLFVTVGAQGDSPSLAVLATPARHRVLLHTDAAASNADRVIEALGLTAKDTEKRSVGDGKNPNTLYRVMHDEWRRQGRPESVGVDLTGGFKTMSAAAAVGACAVPGWHVFYIDNDQPKIHGVLCWINELRIELANPYVEFGDLHRETARRLFATGEYGAAAALFERVHALTDDAGDQFRALLATGYDALERMEFTRAARSLGELVRKADQLKSQGRLDQSDGLVARLDHIRANLQGAERLAELFDTTTARKDLDPVRLPAALLHDSFPDFVEMLVQFSQRLQRSQPDVAALLAYRALEAVPQRRLATLANVDPGNVDWDVLASAASCSLDDLLASYNQAVNAPDHALQRGELPSQLARAATFAVLAVAFPDDVAQTRQIKTFRGIGQARNGSILAHGFRKLEEKDVGSIVNMARGLLDSMLEKESFDADARAKLRQRHVFVTDGV